MAEQSDSVGKHLVKIPVPRCKGPLGVMNNQEFFVIWSRKAKDVYRQHNEMVKRVTPKERLLLFKLEAGWAPLCEFPGKPVPDVPFPRVNETAAVQEKIDLYITESYKRSFVRFTKRSTPVFAVLLAMVAWWYMR